jgi:hypothetical protein
MADPPLNPLMMFRKSWQYFKRRAGEAGSAEKVSRKTKN